MFSLNIEIEFEIFRVHLTKLFLCGGVEEEEDEKKKKIEIKVVNKSRRGWGKQNWVMHPNFKCARLRHIDDFFDPFF